MLDRTMVIIDEKRAWRGSSFSAWHYRICQSDASQAFAISGNTRAIFLGENRGPCLRGKDRRLFLYNQNPFIGVWRLYKRKNCTVFVRIKRDEEREYTKIWKSDVQILLKYKYLFPLLSSHWIQCKIWLIMNENSLLKFKNSIFYTIPFFTHVTTFDRAIKKVDEDMIIHC